MTAIEDLKAQYPLPLLLRIADLPRNSFRGDVGAAADNVLNRQFATTTKHTKWATDVTEFTISTVKVYLSPVLDLYHNRVISAVAGPSPRVKMVTDGLRDAIGVLQPGEKPLVHSDQGFQYRPPPLAGRVALGRADPVDVSKACFGQRRHRELFGHLKEEWFRIQQPSTLDEFHAGLTDYLQWWNTNRVQQRLGYLSPDEYRAQSLALA